MKRDTYRALQPNTRIVINKKYEGKNVGRLGIFVKTIGPTNDGVMRVHLDNKKSTDDIHYSNIDIAPDNTEDTHSVMKKEEPVTIDKIETTVDEEASKDDTGNAPIDPGD